ncbi:hypothetical protein [Actinomycetospora lemnae]|uniref:Nuclear transport factor 2 family protein n=1 Tax=Actinomycetospora lemnae TaxID=3019891 RepID=A0ABT5SQT8_9PSEU|nr:hypothetical protein [Actinomycetospora sp. DW7H6]MDD7965217.1 hypothetical protein [Actinomycetospora sp. DW7H6]
MFDEVGAELAVGDVDVVVRPHRGHDELRAWRRDVPDVAYTLLRAEPTGDGAEADVVIAGDFPGSPVELHYTVDLGDEGRIARLDISPRAS